MGAVCSDGRFGGFGGFGGGSLVRGVEMGGTDVAFGAGGLRARGRRASVESPANGSTRGAYESSPALWASCIVGTYASSVVDCLR